MSNYIIQKIIDDQKSNNLINHQKDFKNEENINFVQTNLDNIISKPESIVSVVSKKVEQNIESVESESTYENIMSEIKQHEIEMEHAIHEADELSKEVKDSIMYYLSIRKPNRNGILMNGIPDVLQASARLLDLSINGRHKLASMKKLRASILKDMNSGKDSNEFSLADLLN